ncbi:Lrp/AsnC family transcriptional regulator [Ktedonosporobacter rubrisoli]|uniref:Lrp/AsnC family transcriptional regulator n=1 Tax=Ktedonosporobacter rubrisoli TaxID=2509675 RepID=A0A4P6JZT7_KTERU|nr:Lrp/AsnC family transcriptional regulator [Ktedonosporobacter rubrisoli]QBD81289.1 Lrp/AsnC family transcriptional regulator [Ktedonosporobacter rubrisoli]
MTLRSEKPLDSTDWKILRELQRDARLSFNELGRRVGLSSPSTAERVRRLEEAGILTDYGARVEPTRVGLPVQAFIQLRCAPGMCLFKTGSAEQFPEVLEMYKLSGNHCALLKVAVSSLPHLEALNERLGRYGEQITNIITSNVLTHRIIDQEQPEMDAHPPTNQSWNVQ